jgi:hypothetical protein
MKIGALPDAKNILIWQWNADLHGQKGNTAENIVPEASQYLCPNQNPSQESVQLVQPSKEHTKKCDADCINKLAPGAGANSTPLASQENRW